MQTLLTIVHVFGCFLMTLAILLQSSKGGGLAGAFGGMGGGGTVFGGRGAATFLAKFTTILAVIFMLTSLSHSLLSRSADAPRSLIQEAAERAPSAADVLPAIPGLMPDATPAGETAPAESPPDAGETSQP